MWAYRVVFLKSLFLMRKLLYRLVVGPDRKMFATITTNCHSYRHHHHHHQNFVFTGFTVFIINVPNLAYPMQLENIQLQLSNVRKKTLHDVTPLYDTMKICNIRILST